MASSANSDGNGLSGSADRVIAVLNLLADAPAVPMSRTEIANASGVSQATCLRILESLRRAGYAVRDPSDKRYRLGPAAIRLGAAARRSFAEVETARPFMSAVSANLQVPVTASAIVDHDHIAVLEVVSPGFGDAPPVGQRYPFAPPVGVIYVAWGPDEDVESWLGRKPLFPLESDVTRLRAVIASCRERGYVVERLNERTLLAERLLASRNEHNLPQSIRDLLADVVSRLGERDYIGDEFRPGARVPVGFIASPAFGPDGKPALMLSLSVGRSDARVEEIRRWGKVIVELADQVTRGLGGVNPWRSNRSSDKGA